MGLPRPVAIWTKQTSAGAGRARRQREPGSHASGSEYTVCSGTSVSLSKCNLQPSGSDTPVTDILFPTNGLEASMPRAVTSQ